MQILNVFSPNICTPSSALYNYKNSSDINLLGYYNLYQYYKRETRGTASYSNGIEDIFFLTNLPTIC